jgi:hypothetical protein
MGLRIRPSGLGSEIDKDRADTSPNRVQTMLSGRHDIDAPRGL